MTTNTVTYNKFALYIKRAACSITKDYVIHVFRKNAIGVVENVEFIDRKNESGQPYYGIVVNFWRVFSGSAPLEKLINDMDKSSDGTTRFYYNDRGYWHIKRHISEPINVNFDEIVEGFDDEMARVAGHLHTELKFSNNRCRKLETRVDNYEKKMTQEKMRVVHLETQLEDVEREKDEYIDIINDLRKEVDILNLDNEMITQNKDKAHNDLEYLKTEVRDFESIINMITKEVQGIRRSIDDNTDIVLKNQILTLNAMLNGIYK
jgi:hypothetical protein